MDDFMRLTSVLQHDSEEAREEILLLRAPPIRRYLTDWQNPIHHLSDKEFEDRYRFTKQGVHDFLHVIEGDLRVPGKGQALPGLHRLLIFLRFASSGSFQLLSGDLEQISQPTVSNVVKEMARIIASKREVFVKWPITPSEIRFQNQNFKKIAQFPGIVGAIGCTHIKIQSPGGDEAERFKNRKGYFSINCQAVCDSNLQFTNIVARWPGSTHDERIFSNSSLCLKYETDELSGIMLGDQGYALKPYLMTPFRFPLGLAQVRYNDAHKKTRLTIDRAFGVLKRIFSCLKTGLRIKVVTTLNVIVACVVLYNFMRMRDMIDTNEYEIDPDPSAQYDQQPTSVRAVTVRQKIADRDFV